MRLAVFVEGARIAEAGDLSRLSELLRQAVGSTPRDRGGHLFGRPHRDKDPAIRLNDALHSPHKLLLCGTVDEYVAGFALAVVDTSSMESTTGLVEELYVEPQARSVGVGEALLVTVVEWCRGQGCSGIDIAALPGDRATKNLCERTGFSARMLWMHRSV